MFDIGAVKFDSFGRVISTFRTPVNPGVPQLPRIAKLTGYTDDDIDGAPLLSEAVIVETGVSLDKEYGVYQFQSFIMKTEVKSLTMML